jgi:menaquinol-cytochrome c reductase iron-sulfur subunit
VESNTENNGTSRRAFHLAVIYSFGAVISFLVAIPTALYLLIPPRLRAGSKYIEAGDVSQLTAGAPVEMSFQENRLDGWKLITEKKTAWVVKEPNNQIVAFGPQCTHLGCAYHFENSQNQFVCPCHNSVFSIDGKVVSGPAPRPLDRYETRVQNNQLEIGQLKTSEPA